MTGPKQRRVGHWRGERRRKKEAKGDSPERQAERHAPTRPRPKRTRSGGACTLPCPVLPAVG
jgi:hypothetical protein